MTEDGSKVFFTTKDTLTTAANQDTDKSADLYRGRSLRVRQLTLTRISTGPKAPATPTPATRSQTPTAPTGTRSAPKQTAASLRSAAVAEWPPKTARSTSSPPSSSQPPTAPKTSPTSTSLAPAQRRASSPPLTPKIPSCSTAVKEAGDAQHRRLPGQPNGEFAVFTSTLPLDRLRQRRPLGGIPLRRRHRQA